jgi:hypothetical protein
VSTVVPAVVGEEMVLDMGTSLRGEEERTKMWARVVPVTSVTNIC